MVCLEWVCILPIVFVFWYFLILLCTLYSLTSFLWCCVLAGKPIPLIKILPRIEENGIEYVWLISLINCRQSTDFLIGSSQRSEGRSLIPHPTRTPQKKVVVHHDEPVLRCVKKITLNRSEVSFSTVAYTDPSPRSGCFAKTAHLARLSLSVLLTKEMACVRAWPYPHETHFFRQTLHALVLDCVPF